MMAPGKRTLFLKGRIANRLGSSTDSAMLANSLCNKLEFPKPERKEWWLELGKQRRREGAGVDMTL
ncbi:hypothetical protein G2W53_019681 [Senna tora]|uniref:Uncharacterized protein n=1 Tax=Senna tora TaxID=362788 RepID=A0A834WMK8_9FABA|nr:hypothetical protein G2W53_019681 [Senna tora]